MNKYTASGFILYFAFILVGCSKGNQTNPVPGPVITAPVVQPPVVLSVGPGAGVYNSEILITGKNFNTNPLLDTVIINGKQAVVAKALSDTLIVLVPLGAVGAGPIIIHINGTTLTLPTFTYVPSFFVVTLAGNGVNDFPYNGASTISTINEPVGIAVDLGGNIYVAEFNRIKKISPNGDLSVFAGSGVFGFKDSINSFAQFKYPTGLAIDLSGNLIVSDRGNSCIRKITPDGTATTLAGSPSYGYADGMGKAGKFSDPSGVAVDYQGNIYVADNGNRRIRKVTSDGNVSTLAGDGNSGYRDGNGTQAEFFDIQSIATDKLGNIYVYEQGSMRVRKITPSGFVSTYAGSTSSLPSTFEPFGMTVDANGVVYVGYQSGISMLDPLGPQFFAGTNNPGYLDGPAATAQFNQPNALTTDLQGNIYVCDVGNARIRKITFQ